MSSRSMGTTAVGLGVGMLAVGLFVQFAIVPGRAQFPDDVERHRYYEGQLGVMLDAEALAAADLANVFVRDVPITIDRLVQTIDAKNGDALVEDSSTVSGPAGPILASDDVFVIDRTTMEHESADAAAVFGDDRVIDRTGLVVGFPIGTEARDYEGWNGDTYQVDVLRYLGEEEHAGLDTYAFSAASGPTPIVDPVVLGALPPALPQAVIAQLVPALGLGDDALAQLSDLLPNLPDPVPLTYTYTYETSYWVEPDSGVLVDYEKVESRQVALDVGGQLVPVADVMQLAYSQTDASVQDAVADAEDAKSALLWQGRVLPLALILGGVLIAAFGAVALGRSRD